MTTANRIRIVLALLLVAAAFTVQQNPEAVNGFSLPSLSWPWSSSKVVQSVIIEETSARAKLPQAQIIVLQKALSLGIPVIDKDIVGADNKQPAELAPFLAATKDKPLPQLARKWSSGKITAIALPLTLDKLKELK